MTTALLGASLRDDLRSKAGLVEDLVQRSADQQPAAYRTRKARQRDWYRRIEDAVLDLANALPAGTEDYEARQLFVFLTELRRRVEADSSGADKDGRVRLTATRMGDVVRRMERRLEHSALEDPAEAARHIFEWLGGVGATDLARILGVSTKTVGAWRAGKPVMQKVARVKLVAQLVSYLRYSMTPTGVVMWFDNPADLLDGRSPVSLLDEGVQAAWAPLTSYARGGRGQLAG